MSWIIVFIVSWLLFIFLVDLKHLRTNIWCGIAAACLQLSVDTQAISHNLYSINNPIISLWGSSLLFVFGPVFVIGTLLAQYHPIKKIMVLLNIVILTLLYTSQEIFLLSIKSLVYHHWHVQDSVVVNFSAMCVLSWFSIVVLNKLKVFK